MQVSPRSIARRCLISGLFAAACGKRADPQPTTNADIGAPAASPAEHLRAEDLSVAHSRAAREANPALPATTEASGRRVLDKGFDVDSPLFERKAEARTGEWLAEHHELYQSFPDYQSKRKALTSEPSLIVLQPLDDIVVSHAPLLESLRDYMARFFAAEVRLAPAVRASTRAKRTRRAGSARWDQYFTGAILEETLLPRVQPYIACVLGITMHDLYPQADWNFAFGEASLEERVGVFSLHRFVSPQASPKSQELLLRRSMHTLAHETGHMFSVTHCTKFECVMNGSNSLEEADGQSAVVCPHCLRKLHYARGFDLIARYRALRDFYAQHGLVDLQHWSERRLLELVS